MPDFFKEPLCWFFSLTKATSKNTIGTLRSIKPVTMNINHQTTSIINDQSSTMNHYQSNIIQQDPASPGNLSFLQELEASAGLQCAISIQKARRFAGSFVSDESEMPISISLLLMIEIYRLERFLAPKKWTLFEPGDKK